MEPDELRRAAERWSQGDPDPVTRRQLESMLEEGDVDGLRAHLDGRLEFGTAGLRAPVGPGPRRMNRAVVIRTTAGVLAQAREAADGPPVVVVGFDARPDSERFARDAVGVLVAGGASVAWFPTPIPTPLVAYAAKRRRADAAVVITASHNPPADNGYKVYGPGGVQIVPPADAEIAARIEGAPPATEVPRVEDPGSHHRVEVLGADLEAQYRRDIAAIRPGVPVVPLTIAYTPLHGVGGRHALAALGDAGFPDVVTVPEQHEPDGAFPTVSFPNPEEPGALDLVRRAATAAAADVVLANDPDADRLAVAVPDERGGWRQLSGNQVGLLLADHLLAATESPAPLVVSSVVSTPALGALAAEHGARWETTLTGFKWICTAAVELARSEGLELVLGYEEALGYTVGEVVRDKDGIAAAAVMAGLVASLRGVDRTVQDALADLARRIGLWVSHQHSEQLPGAAGAEAIDAAMRRAHAIDPRRLGARDVAEIIDYAEGAEARPRWLPDTDLVAFELDAGRALVRPSGTEPKLKVYVDLRGEPVGALRDREQQLRDEAAGIAADLVERLGLEPTDG